MSKDLKYRPDIDGLRAVAVLAVLFFHANLGFSGGFVGVDVFFVISGYLITGLILKDIERGQFQILEFWARRVRRILPALGMVIISCLVAGWFFFLPTDFEKLGQSVFAQALLASNFYFWSHSGYFDLPAVLMPLLHTWSLAVEEQFYLIYPFFLIALKGRPRHALILILVVLTGVSFCLSVYCSYFHASAGFYFLPTRAWELSIGALPATLLMRREPSRWLRESLSWVGILAIFYAIFFYDRETQFPGFAAILPCAGTALIIWANSSIRTSVGRLLALPPLVFLGLISYSLYLWHWPVLVFARYLTPYPLSETQRLLLLLASAILAAASWRFVEMPFRKRSILKSRVQILSFAGITTAVLMLAGFIISKLEGIPSRFSAQALAYANGSIGAAYQINMGLKEALNGEFVELGPGDRHLPIKLFVWGDSHAMAILSILDTLCKEHAVRGVAATHFATFPLLDFEWNNKSSLQEDAIPYNNAVIKFIKKNQVGDVVLVARWGSLYGTNSPQLHRCLLETIDALKNSGARVWIMRQVPRPGMNVPQVLALAVLHDQDLGDLSVPLTYYQEDRLLQDRLFQGISPADATILDPAKLFLGPKNQIIVADGGKSLYFDGDHLSDAGAMKLRPLFEPIFAEMVKKTPKVGTQP